MNVTDDDFPLSALSDKQTENIGMIIAGIAAAIGAVTYSCRHLKTSNCCGFSCTQVVTDAPIQAPIVVCPDGKPGVALETQV